MASQAAQWRRIRSFIKGRSSSNLRRTASWVASRSMQLHLAITMPTVQVIVAQFLGRAGAGLRGRRDGRTPRSARGDARLGWAGVRSSAARVPVALPFLSARRVEKGLQSSGHLADLLD